MAEADGAERSSQRGWASEKSWIERQNPKLLICLGLLIILASAVGYFALREAQQTECAELGGSIYHPLWSSEIEQPIEGAPAGQTSCISADGDVLLVFPGPPPN